MIEHSKGQVTCRTVIDEAKLGKMRSLGVRKETVSGVIEGRKRIGKMRSLGVHPSGRARQDKD
jgi:N-acetylglutamate synthase-like GNAT family acetyltransferase